MTKSIRALTFLFLAISFVGCAAVKKAIEDSSGPLTADSLAKSWTGSCTAGSDPITSADHYNNTLTLNADGTFSSMNYWYTGTCAGANYTIAYGTTGTFTVGGYVNGSSTIQSLNFDVTTSDLMAFTTAAQTSVNTACGGTSPFIGGVNATYNGTHHSSYMMTCAGQDLPNSANRSVDNIVELTSGVLALGAGNSVIPGVFTGSTVPVTTSDFYY